ncbi:hypothetical protein VMCG_06123 [Cytospora schulzeri]|uniref:ubiquitinyl hydrolase 1 n=1 Tax=Cytospora schulzeri TaxID=448051 RepID=A0A423WGG8_9PEZI|nr:hypothetical protein VMCG_06123 [Valsa malicola]
MGDNGFGYQTRSQGPPPAYSAVDQSPKAYPQHKDLGRPGQLASKWICDLLNGTLDCNKLACLQLNSPTPIPHNLYFVSSQSSAGFGDNTALAVSICRTCKKTFTVRLECPGHACAKNFERMHHLVLGTVLDTPGLHTKYYPMESQVQFTCSAVDCTMSVTIDVCDPRLDVRWEAHLTDRDAVRERLQELMMADDRSRYEDLTHPDRLEKLFPAFYLMQYIHDVVRSGPGVSEKKVAYRNKFFTVCFWDRFQELLEYLEFKTTEGDGDKSLVLPCLDERSPTDFLPATRQAWFEIVRAHLYFLVEDHLRADLLPPMELSIQSQSVTYEFLESLLDAKYSKSTWKHIGDLSSADFDLLGINKDAHESMLWYACLCQGQTHPEGREKYFDALCRVTRNRENASAELRKYIEEEQLELAIVKSTREAQADSDPLSKAYRTLELPHSASEDMVIAQFQHNLKAASPAERKKLRQDVSLIGRDRKSPEIMRTTHNFEPEEAMEFLGLPAEADPAFIPIQVNANVNEDKSIDRLLVAGALRSLSSKKYHNGDMDALATVLELDAREPWMSEGDSITVEPKSTSQTVGGTSVDTSLPVGLMNIRNTCYLNSILQYFNTVLPVRSVVLNWEEYKLEPTEENIKTRRLGGTGVALDKPEAFLAAKFVEEMRSLFLEFQSSTASAIKPQQRLALAALKNADKLLQAKPAEPATTVIGPQPNPNASDKDQAPPPLPARPSPKPPTVSAEPTVTVNAISDHADTASNVSSATLVDQKDEDANQTYVTISETHDDKSIPQVVPAKERVALDDDDKAKAPESEEATSKLSAGQENVTPADSAANMGGTDANANTTAVEEKIEDTLSVEEKITEALNDVSVTGTEQQDVEEVMGNILDHFHAAIKPTGTDEDTGKQKDIITETFYWSSVVKIRTVDMNTGKAESDFRSVPDLSRWMTAFPAKYEKTDLYGALDSNFDQEFQEDGNEMVTAITRAPPILHIYIQRGQEIKGKLSRNNNVVEIPKRLYLDRYMDCSTDSDLFKKRQRSWNLKRRLQALDVGPPPEPVKDDKKGKNEEIKEAGYEVVDQNVEDYETQMFIDNGEEEYVSINVPSLQPLSSDKDLLPENLENPSGDVTMGGIQESSPANLDGDASRRLRAQTEGEKSKVREELSTLFSDMKDVVYRLHAVICHGGGLGFGHYWVWIYDFDENVWRSYNDERVEVHRDEEKVLNDLNSSGRPYYVAYVREDEISRMVKIPSRNLVAPSATDAVTTGVPGDIEMHDAEVSHPDLNSVDLIEPAAQESSGGSTGEEDAHGDEVPYEEWQASPKQQATEEFEMFREGDEQPERSPNEVPTPEKGRKPDRRLSEGDNISMDDGQSPSADSIFTDDQTLPTQPQAGSFPYFPAPNDADNEQSSSLQPSSSHLQSSFAPLQIGGEPSTPARWEEASGLGLSAAVKSGPLPSISSHFTPGAVPDGVFENYSSLRPVVSKDDLEMQDAGDDAQKMHEGQSQLDAIRGFIVSLNYDGADAAGEDKPVDPEQRSTAKEIVQFPSLGGRYALGQDPMIVAPTLPLFVSDPPVEASQPSSDDHVPDHLMEALLSRREELLRLVGPAMEAQLSQGEGFLGLMEPREARPRKSRQKGQEHTGQTTIPREIIDNLNSLFTAAADTPHTPHRSRRRKRRGQSTSYRSIFDPPEDDPYGGSLAFQRLKNKDGVMIVDGPGAYGITEIRNAMGVRVAKGSSSRGHSEDNQTPTLNKQVIDIHIDDDLVGAAEGDAPWEKFRRLMSSSPLGSRSSALGGRDGLVSNSNEAGLGLSTPVGVTMEEGYVVGGGGDGDGDDDDDDGGVKIGEEEEEYVVAVGTPSIPSPRWEADDED